MNNKFYLIRTLCNVFFFIMNSSDSRYLKLSGARAWLNFNKNVMFFAAGKEESG